MVAPSYFGTYQVVLSEEQVVTSKDKKKKKKRTTKRTLNTCKGAQSSTITV